MERLETVTLPRLGDRQCHFRVRRDWRQMASHLLWLAVLLATRDTVMLLLLSALFGVVLLSVAFRVWR
jgi:hypothetical protein